MVYSSHKTAESDQFKTWEAKEETLPSRSFTSERSRSLEPVRTILDRPRINAGPAEITNAGVARLSPFNFGRGGMFVGPIVSQSPSGQSLIAFRRRHGCGAIAHRSANACSWASPGTPQACSGFRPAAFGSFVISQDHADAPIPVGSHRRADSSDGRRTVARRRTVWLPRGRNRLRLQQPNIQTMVALHRNDTASIRCRYTARHRSNPRHMSGFGISRSRNGAGFGH